jgi:DNA polymerase III epsilon subunit-like protein
MRFHFVALDTETTGFLDDADAHVIEVAAVGFDAAGKVKGTFGSLVRPPVLTPAGLQVARDISGITEAEIRGALPPETIWPSLLRFLGDNGGPICVWNADFDPPFLSRTFLGGKALPFADIEDVAVTFAQRFAARLEWDAKRKRPRFARLSRAAEWAGVTFTGPAHRALADAIVCGEIKHALDNGLAPAGAP